MNRIILILAAIFFTVLAAQMWFAPQYWYDNTPGVSNMGPFNLHFILDAALAFLASGLAIIWGLVKHDKTALIFGAFWPCLYMLLFISGFGLRCKACHLI